MMTLDSAGRCCKRLWPFLVAKAANSTKIVPTQQNDGANCGQPVDLWSLVTVLTDPASHPHASGGYDPWCRPEPRRDFFLSLAFAAQRGGSKMLREAGKRRRDRRAAGRYATGTRA